MSAFITVLVFLIVISLFGLLFSFLLSQTEEDEEKEVKLPTTPESSPQNKLRKYTVTYKKGEQNVKIRTFAQDRYDAKYRAFTDYKIDLKSILSVV